MLYIARGQIVGVVYSGGIDYQCYVVGQIVYSGGQIVSVVYS